MQKTLTRRIFLRWSGMALAGLGTVAAVGACAPQPAAAPTQAPAAAEPAKPTAAPAAPAAKEPVTLKLNHRAGGEKSEAPIYVQRPAEFMEANPNIKVELAPIPGAEYWVKSKTMAAAGTIGDVMWTSDVWTDHRRFCLEGVIASVDEYLEAAKVSKEEWRPATVQTLTVDGKLYGLPKCSHANYPWIIVNVDAFKEAGLPEPEVWGNKVETLLEWAKKLTKGTEDKRERFGFYPQVGAITAFATGGRQFGTYENNDDGTASLYDNAQWLAWAKWIEEFFKQKIAPLPENIPSGGIVSMFASGNLAMWQASRGGYYQSKSAVEAAAKPFAFKFIVAPKVESPKGWAAGVDTHSATTASKHGQEAFELVYALSDKRFTELVAKGLGYLGARVDDIDTVKPFTNPYLEAQYKVIGDEEPFHQPANCRGTEVELAIKNHLDLAWLGKEAVSESFMQRLKVSVDEVLKKAM